MLLLIAVIIIIIGALYFLGMFDDYIPVNYNSESITNHIKTTTNNATGNVGTVGAAVSGAAVSGATVSAASGGTYSGSAPIKSVVITPESSNNTNNSIKAVEDIKKIEATPTPEKPILSQVMPVVMPAVMPAIVPQVSTPPLYTSSASPLNSPITTANYPYGSPIADAEARLTHSAINNTNDIYVRQATPQPLPIFKLKNKTKNNICMNRMSDDYLQKQLCEDKPDQLWSFTPDKKLISSTNSNMCLSSGRIMPNGENRIYATYCKSNDSNQQWQYKDAEKLLLNIGSGKCLDDGGGPNVGDGVYFKVHACDSANFNQQYYEN